MFDLPLLAGAISSAMFVVGTLPMIYKAIATKSLQSYSMSSLLFNNLGNLLHALYVYSLPPGPIWLLHSFHLVTTALMLFWYLRYEGWRKGKGSHRQRVQTVGGVGDIRLGGMGSCATSNCMTCVA